MASSPIYGVLLGGVMVTFTRSGDTHNSGDRFLTQLHLSQDPRSKLSQGERVQIEALFVHYPEGAANREEWGRLADGRGWMALWYAGSQLAVLDDSPAWWEVVVS